MSVLFDYVVNFQEKSDVPTLSLGFLKRVGVFVKPKTPALDPITFITQPNNQTGEVGDRKTATVEVEGSDFGNWHKVGDGELIGEDETTIEWDPAGTDDNGEYFYRAGNESGNSLDSDTITVNITEPEEEGQALMLNAPESDFVVNSDKSMIKVSNSPIAQDDSLVMFEVTQATYSEYTENESIQGFFDGGMGVIYLIMTKSEADSIENTPEYQPLDHTMMDTICYSEDYTTTQALDMLVSGFTGSYVAVTSSESNASEFISAGANNFCLLDGAGVGYGMCSAVGYHLSRVYWRNNQYYQPNDTSRITGITDSGIARGILEKGISFFIEDPDQGVFLAFFGNTNKGIAEPYIRKEVQMRSQESLTQFVQRREPTNTAIDLALAQQEGNEPLRMFEQEPYRYLDPDYDNRVTITSSGEKYKATGEMEIRIPSAIWVFDIESTVVS